GAGRPQRDRSAARHHSRRLSLDPAGVHLRAAGDHRQRAVHRHPRCGGQLRLPRPRDAAAPGRAHGPRSRRYAGGADALARVGVQLVLDAADVGRVPQAAARRERAAARHGGARHYRAIGRARSAVDSVHEVHLVPALHLSAERAGLHRAADRCVLPFRHYEQTAERHRGPGGAVDRVRARRRALGARARQDTLACRQRVVVDGGDQLPAFRRAAVRRVHRDPRHRQPHDPASGARAGRGSHVSNGFSHRRRGHSPARAARADRVLTAARGGDRRLVDRVRVNRRCAMRGAWCVAALVLAAACRVSDRPTVRPSDQFDPAHDLGTLFHDVQLSGIFPDSKTFVDARPLVAPAVIVARYDSARRAPGFNLQSFVQQYFELPRPAGEGFVTDTAQTMEEHIRALWPVLTRAPDQPDARSSLIPLPDSYVVPGGRFREVYYWDSYFTMLGLIASGRTELMQHMLDNFAYL